MRRWTIFIFILLSAQSFAQSDYVFSPIDSSDGLSDNRVRTISQLTDGRMAIITEGLVNIYDGASFRYIHYDDRMAYNLSGYRGWHHVYVDNEKQLWLKNQQKLFLFDISKEMFVSSTDSLFLQQGVDTPVSDIFMDSQKNFWYLTSNDDLLYRRSEQSKAQLFLKNVSKVDGVPDKLYDVVLHQGQLFLLYKSGSMVCYDLKTRKKLYSENPFNGENKYEATLSVSAYENYLYQVRNGNNTGLLLRFNIKSRRWEQLLETNYWLNTLTIDQAGSCWVSTFTGLWLIDQNAERKRLISPLHLVDGRLLEAQLCTQYNDNSGGLWVGTVNRGVFYYHPDRFKFRNFGRSLFKIPQTKELSVRCFAQTDGYTFVGSSNGVFRYNYNSMALEQFGAIPPTVQCEMFLKDCEQRIWLCTQNKGLYCIESNNNIKHYDTADSCLSIFESFDKHLYLCTSRGISILEPAAGRFEKILSPNNANTYQLVHYTRDTLLGYCDAGLFLLDCNTKTISFPDKNSPLQQHNNHRYHCLYSDSRGLIWIGTMDGLNVFDPAKNLTRTFFEKDGLINNSVRSIIEDNSGRIWVSTSNGISSIDVGVVDGVYRYTFRNYNRFDGVIDTEFLPRSVFKTSSNSLLWGGLDGFNELELGRVDRPEKELSLPLFTKLLISGVEVRQNQRYDGNLILAQSISSTSEITLKHFQNYISIEFSALNYVNPTQTYYRYKLEGVDNLWKEIKTSDGIGRINYTNLPSGRYKLIVSAAGDNRQWSDKTAVITISIKPPFWRAPWAVVLYAILSLLAIYYLISYYFRQSKLKMEQRQKEELEEMKYSFFTNVSHELRTPLTLILTPLESLIKKTEEQTVKTQLGGIFRNANELLKLVNQLLDFRKLEIKGETLELSYCNIGEFVKTISQSFSETAAQEGIELVTECEDENIFAFVDRDKIQKIVNNLLSNAIKFTPSGGVVKLNLYRATSESMIVFRVSDTGIGISEVDKTQIFERFYQVKKRGSVNVGSGIGLHLVNEYVGLHGGTIEVESSEGYGAAFTVKIPDNLHPQSSKIGDDEPQSGGEGVKILIVEDNSEFRNFLKTELSEKFTVMVATNGKEGLEYARKQLPDLIISDVMMPEMSGTEMCSEIKKDIRTSHIPLILLTAKSSDKAQIEGFEVGADAYISKPFNMEILLLRVRHLLELQEQRKSQFRNAITINPGIIASTDLDQKLIKDALGHIEKNLDNAAYSVEQLSRDMFMDRTGLYRKLSAIVGQTPSEFIRSVRLKRAAQLLESGLPVSEVSQMVGFGTTSYFAKCFQEEFGTKPSIYKNVNRGK